MTHTIGIPLIGGSRWVAGWGYMMNLVETLAAFGPAELEACVLAGSDQRDHPDLLRLSELPRTRVVWDERLDPASKSRRLAQAIVTGRDSAALDVFRSSGIDVIFEVANFFGWRLPIPAIAWIPDFQHRALPQFFTRAIWLRREVGLRAQIGSGRTVMLSSRAAEADCLEFYPGSRGRTRVVSFAVATDRERSVDDAIATARALGLGERFFFLPNQLWAHKNHRVAIEAAAVLKRMGDSSMIVATGPASDHRAPKLREELDALIATLGVADQFRFLGHISYPQVRALGLCCTAAINPSRFEGWSTTVEEAKAQGTPLLLSDLPVHREQATTAARFFGPDDPAQLAELIRSTPTRSPAEIERHRAQAAALNETRRREFAAAFADVVEGALEMKR